MRDCRRGYLQNLFISTATCLMRPIEGLKQSHFIINLYFSRAINVNHFYTVKNSHYFCSKYPPKAFFKVSFSKFSWGRSPNPTQRDGVTPSHTHSSFGASRLKVPLQATSTLPFSNSSWSTD